MSLTNQHAADPIKIQIVSTTSPWKKLVDVSKDITAITAVVGAILAWMSSPETVSNFVNVFKPIKENSNPTKSEVVVPDDVTVGSSTAILTGWSYLGKEDNEGDWYFTKQGNKPLTAGDLQKDLILYPKTKMFVRVSPMTATNTNPRALGTVDPDEKQCFKLEKPSLNERTKSIWLEGDRIGCPD